MVLQSEVWPEAWAEGVLIISGDDGEPVDRTTYAANAGQRYSVVGNFIYDLQGFTESGNILTYTLSTPVPRRFAFIGAITAKGDVPGTVIHYSVYHNGFEIFPKSISGTYMKTADQAQALAGYSFFVDLEQTDTLELKAWSGVAGESIITTHLNYTVFPIGRQHH